MYLSASLTPVFSGSQLYSQGLAQCTVAHTRCSINICRVNDWMVERMNSCCLGPTVSSSRSNRGTECLACCPSYLQASSWEPSLLCAGLALIFLLILPPTPAPRASPTQVLLRALQVEGSSSPFHLPAACLRSRISLSTLQKRKQAPEVKLSCISCPGFGHLPSSLRRGQELGLLPS